MDWKGELKKKLCSISIHNTSPCIYVQQLRSFSWVDNDSFWILFLRIIRDDPVKINLLFEVFNKTQI